jgi:phage protein D
MFQPDMAQIVLSNQGDEYTTTLKIGDAIEIKVGDSATSVYKGEVVGVEPIYKGGEKTRVVIRAMNKLHRLIRVRKSMTYTDKSDRDILSQVLSDAGLQIDWKCKAAMQYKHVYQHNQTALEFLRMRAGRIGAYVWCVDSTVFVHDPELQDKPIKTLTVDKQGDGDTALREFRPRMSSAAIVKKVTVKGWNPETKQLITGQASAQNSALGKENAASGAGTLAGDETFTVDHPIWSTEEATALATARLQDASMSFITGEAVCTGDPAFDIGKVVTVTPNADPDAKPDDDPFNGNYYIVGLTHRHTQSKSKDGGYMTVLRLARDAQKKKS